MTTQSPVEVVLDVAPEEQEAYARCSYRDYLRAWNELVQMLKAARESGDLEETARLTDELRHVWPQPADVAGAAWIPVPERERPLRTDGAF